MPPMRRRITAWIALLAMCFGAALPAHAYAHLRQADAMAGDLCTSAAAKSTPLPPDTSRHAACDACGGCATPLAPATARAPAIARAAYVPGLAPARIAAASAHVDHFLARAPPSLR
jgi:hypothetical protein